MRRLVCAFIFSLCVCLSINIRSSFAYTTNMSASVVVGQSDFSGFSPNKGGTVSGGGYDYPYDAVVIKDKLVVTDYNNSRLLVYNTIPYTNGAIADVVIGQPDMTSSSENQG